MIVYPFSEGNNFSIDEGKIVSFCDKELKPLDLKFKVKEIEFTVKAEGKKIIAEKLSDARFSNEEIQVVFDKILQNEGLTRVNRFRGFKSLKEHGYNFYSKPSAVGEVPEEKSEVKIEEKVEETSEVKVEEKPEEKTVADEEIKEVPLKKKKNK